MSGKPSRAPRAFENAREQILSARLRSELVTQEISAPERIAPYSVAIGAGVKHRSDDLASGIHSESGSGRLVLLYDPDSANEWGSDFRIICYAQAPLEPEIGSDPFIAEVMWSWLLESLEISGAAYNYISGTATNISSTGFGTLSEQGSSSGLELRASWSPTGDNFDAHAVAWSNLLCFLAGYPQEEGAISFDAYRIQHKKSRD